MSYQEFAKLANRYHYIPYDELMFGRTKRTDTAQDDRIFESPVFGAKMAYKKDPLVKGGDIHKNTAI